MKFTLEGLSFDGGLSGSTPFTISEMYGWDVGGAELRRQRDQRPGSHGAFSSRGFLTDRLIGWSGLVLTDAPDDQQHALMKLSGLLAAGGSAVLSGAGMSATVERDKFTSGIVVPGKVARYSVAFSAPDARLYGDTHRYAAGEEAVHYGNFPARPKLIVSGASASGYTVTGPGGRVVTVTKAITSGAPHTIDFAKGGLWIGGVRQLRAITVYQPWEIGPGLASAVATVDNGLSVVQEVQDTFV